MGVPSGPIHGIGPPDLMEQPDDVIIVGGGLAGSSAAIHLSGMGYSVRLLEKDRMPRDKLCGEFLSTEVAEMCRSLGVLDRMTAAGAREIRRVRVTSCRGRAFETTLPGTALGISRTTLDRIYFERAIESGARAHQDCPVRSIQGNLNEGFTVSSDDHIFHGKMALGAYGRQSTLDRQLNRRVLGDRSPYVAFKAHYVGIDLADSIELHAFPGGYCGLLSEDHHEINVCWISHRDVLKKAGGSPENMIAGIMRENPALADRLSAVERVGDFFASSQLTFRARPMFAGDVCLIGDAAGMIAPWCGDGMAMAIRSSEMAAELVNRLLIDRVDASVVRADYVRVWRRRFRKRMRLGHVMHAGYVRPAVSELGVVAAQLMPRVARAMIRGTRG